MLKNILLVAGLLTFVATSASASTQVDGIKRAVAEDESIYVVQERGFSKSGKFELEIYSATKVNPKFVGYWGMGLSAAYHLRENFAFEFNSSIPYAWAPFFSDLVYEVFEYETLAPQTVDLKVMDYNAALSLQFSALYGKLKFRLPYLGAVLLDYDLYAVAGVGVAHTLQACQPHGKDGCGEHFDVGRGLREQEEFTDVWKLTGNIGGGLRFFFSDFMGVRFEVRDIVYSDRDVQENQTTTDVRNNVMFSSGVSFLF